MNVEINSHYRPDKKKPIAKIVKSDQTKSAPVKAKKEIKESVTLSPKSKKLAQKSESLKQIKKRVIGSRFVNKPAIFFIGGFNFISSTNDGMKEMAEHVKAARFYDWDQKDEMVKEIMKRPAHQPVILVGHSLGGDTAVEIAQELNNLDHNFRKVNLLVTLDSFGFNNDIIPQNVERNINFIGHKSLWLNDGPNIARDAALTKVTNELRDEAHTELDDSEQIQYKILNAINSTMGATEESKSEI